MSRKPFDDRNNANRLLSLKVMMEGSHHQSQLTLEVDQIDHLFPFGTAGKFKLVFLQNMTTTGVQLKRFLSASWRIQGNGYYPSFA